MTVLAIDPGPVRSAWVHYDDGRLAGFGIEPNDELLWMLRHRTNHGNIPGVDTVVIEKVEGYGMPVGAEVFETVYWSGRFAQAADPLLVHRIGRKAVKLHLCQSMRAKDPNIRQALIDRYGGSAAIGRKATPGPLYGVSGDVWAALAVAVTFADSL